MLSDCEAIINSKIPFLVHEEFAQLVPYKEILDLNLHAKLFAQTLPLIPGHVVQKLERRHKNRRRVTQARFQKQSMSRFSLSLAQGDPCVMVCAV